MTTRTTWTPEIKSEEINKYVLLTKWVATGNLGGLSHYLLADFNSQLSVWGLRLSELYMESCTFEVLWNKTRLQKTNLITRRWQQKAVDFSGKVDQDQLVNPLTRLHSDVREEDAGIRVLNGVSGLFGRELLRKDGVDDEAVRVVDVNLAVARGDNEEGAVWWPNQLPEGRKGIFVHPNFGNGTLKEGRGFENVPRYVAHDEIFLNRIATPLWLLKNLYVFGSCQSYFPRKILLKEWSLLPWTTRRTLFKWCLEIRLKQIQGNKVIKMYSLYLKMIPLVDLKHRIFKNSQNRAVVVQIDLPRGPRKVKIMFTIQEISLFP